MSNISSKQLVEIFEHEMSESPSFKHLDNSINPCHVVFEGTEFYVYIKNLSSAYFTNKDVCRAQLTGIDSLKSIKESDSFFILLAYYEENDTFAVWNPHIAKQRIGMAKSPSFYSRLTLQNDAATKHDFVSLELKNEGSVLAFPRENILSFMENIEIYFPDTSKYVAMGSKRRSDANLAYKNLIDSQNLLKYKNYLLLSYSNENDEIKLYVDAIKYLQNNSLLSKYRKFFLAYDNINDYASAYQELLEQPEIANLNQNNNDVFSYALPLYINFLIEEYGDGGNNDDDLEEEYSYSDDDNYNDCIDYEASNTDGNGILKKITNPKLLELLKPDLDTEYPRPMAAFATIEDFYGDRFPKMEIYQWQILFNKIKWDAL